MIRINQQIEQKILSALRQNKMLIDFSKLSRITGFSRYTISKYIIKLYCEGKVGIETIGNSQVVSLTNVKPPRTNPPVEKTR